MGSTDLNLDQVERFSELTRDTNVDCVITISNQFATNPEHHPIDEVRKSGSKIPVFRWSLMHILTFADVLMSQGAIENNEQLVLLNEMRRFLAHPSTGVKGFDRMPREWTEINRIVSRRGALSPKPSEMRTVIDA